MKKFNSLEELIEAKGRKQHEANLARGGVFTLDPEDAIKRGYEVSKEGRISNLKQEIRLAEKGKTVQWCGAAYSKIIMGVKTERPVNYIKNLGYVEL